MTKTIYDKIENLLIGEDGILISLRFGDGLPKSLVKNLFYELEKLSNLLIKEKSIPKSFFYLIVDSIMVISSSVDINEDKKVILHFLDEFVDKLKENEDGDDNEH